MKNIKNPLTEKDTSTLKDARRILKRLTKKYRKWQDKICSLNSADADAETERYNAWLDSLYDSAKIDFLDKAFISLDD